MFNPVLSVLTLLAFAGSFVCNLSADRHWRDERYPALNAATWILLALGFVLFCINFLLPPSIA